MSFIAAALIGGGTALIGGAMSSRAAGQAADAQAAAAAQSDATQRYQYDTTRADNAPFRETGLAANNKLAELMNSGQFGRRFTQADMNADPVYQSGLQFGLDQGTQGINRQAAAGGNFLSGATLKALTRFGNDYGSTKANESYNRFNTDQNSQYNKLAGLSGAGQQATNQVSSAGQNMANNISQSQQGVGNARASGYVGSANAWNGALGQAVNGYQQIQMMNSLYRQPYGYSGVTGYAPGADPLGDFISKNRW
jgi:hypothetical protein